MGAWALSLPDTAVAEALSANIYVLHDVNALDLDPAAAGFPIVVSGHSHKPGRCEREGVPYINPGSAGPRRFHLPITGARLNACVRPWALGFVELGRGGRVDEQEAPPPR